MLESSIQLYIHITVNFCCFIAPPSTFSIILYRYEANDSCVLYEMCRANRIKFHNCYQNDSVSQKQMRTKNIRSLFQYIKINSFFEKFM